jgi:hypothetical protein
MIRHRYQLIKDEETNKILGLCPARLKNLISGNVFERAIFEHNLISLSKVYENINFTTLERFLEMDIHKVNYFTKKSRPII